MRPLERLFVTLDTVIDEVHDLFEHWRQEDDLQQAVGEVGLDMVQLAVHEWIANLIQHADFGEETPLIRLELAREEGGARCIVDDNSRGFDLESKLVGQRIELEAAAAPPERGRGLIMMASCTEDLHYAPISRDGGAILPGPLYHRLDFRVDHCGSLEESAPEHAADPKSSEAR